MEMLAAVSREAHGPFSLEQVTLDPPRPDEVLVEIAGVGLCHTDLIARDGFIPVQLPAVFGHEGAGRVLAVGSAVTKVKVGDHVVLSFGSCGHCGSCTHSDPAYCDSSGVLNYSGGRADGSHAIHGEGGPISSHFFAQSSFANLALAYERNAVVIDQQAPLELMGPLGCGVQTGAGAIMNTLACKAGSSLLITGGGSLGLSAVLAAVVQGCSTIIVAEPHASRRELALELGATHVVDPTGAESLGELVRAIVAAGVDYAFDTTGLPQVTSAAVGALGKRGTLVIAGVPPTPDSAVQVPILPLVGMGQTVKGVVEGDSDPDVFIPRLVALYREGRFPFDRLIRTYPLSQINQAVADHQSGGCVKAVLIP